VKSQDATNNALYSCCLFVLDLFNGALKVLNYMSSQGNIKGITNWKGQ